MRTAAWTGVGGAALMAASAAAYSPPVRRWYLHYGATDEEITRVLPGDDLLPDADVVSTRAVTIEAAPATVWPWLLQMSSGRVGSVSPQCQQLAVGDVLPVGPTGPGMRVEILDPERTLAFRSTDGAGVWIFHLDTRWLATRLISRNRIAAGASWPRRLVDRVVTEPGNLVMERRILQNIKERAQRSAPSAESMSRLS
jgi:hypothetical protein